MDVASRDEQFHLAIFGFDDAALELWITQRTGAGGSDGLVAEVARAWLALMRGGSASVATGAGEALARAASSRVPARVVEVTVLRAMLALSAGQLSEALAFGRRASLLARSEALPGAGLLANIVLSRLRRHSGKSHLAVRILESCARSEGARAAPGWLEWERLLAGGNAGVEPSADASPSARAAGAGQRVLLAARAGERARFEREVAALELATAGFVDIQREALGLCALLDPARGAGEPLAGFKRGEHDELWQGLASARVMHDDSEADVAILAVARPGERGTRLLRDGLGLFGPCRTFFEESTRAYGRTDTGLAVLALGGPEAMPEEEFFLRVYGFAYSHGKHRGVLDVLLHRIRQRVGASGALARAGGGVRLELGEAIAIADPRCSPPAAARVLSALSRQPATTAEAVAGRLGITPRAAQMALRELVSDGACEVRRSGRQVRYQLLDSAFSEPTGTDVFG